MGANLFQAYLQPPKSVVDYQNDYEMLDARRNQNALQSLALKQQAEQAEQAAADRNALQRAASGWTPQTTPEERAASLYGTGRASLAAQADTILKTATEREKGKAAALKDQAEADKVKLATDYMRRDRHLQSLANVTTPEQAAEWISQGVQLGEFSMQDAQRVLQGIQSGQIPLDQWKQRAQQGGMTLQQQAQQRLQDMEFGLKANNELIGPDGKPNQPLINAKQQIARAGASSVSVNTGQKGIENELKLRDDIRSEPVYKAYNEVKSAYSQIQQGLKLASPAGDLAAATKIMKLLDPGSVVRESELGMAMAATGLMDRVSNYAQNILSGNKLTPQQRKDFAALADALYGESVKQYNAKRGEYQSFAKDWGLNADRVTGPEASAPKPAAVIRFDANGNQL